MFAGEIRAWLARGAIFRHRLQRGPVNFCLTALGSAVGQIKNHRTPIRDAQLTSRSPPILIVSRREPEQPNRSFARLDDRPLFQSRSNPPRASGFQSESSLCNLPPSQHPMIPTWFVRNLSDGHDTSGLEIACIYVDNIIFLGCWQKVSTHGLQEEVI